MHLNNKKLFLIAFVAGLICLTVYLRSLTCGFVNFDDPELLLENTAIRSLDKEFWIWSFATVSLNFWAPLLWLSYAIDYHFWGLDPFGYHLTNIVLHAVNSGLVVVVADGLYRNKLGKIEEFSRSKYLYPGMLLVAGLLFGIHPARVESVAWVTERKDVLNGLFTLSAIYFYLRYQQKKLEAEGGVCLAYGLSLVLFLLSLMAKPSSVLVPVALLVIDWYPLGRLQKGMVLSRLAEKVPYMVLAVPVIAASMVFRAQQGGYNSLRDFPFAVRAAAAGNSVFEYFKLMLCPVGILPYYSLPRGVPQVYIVKAFLVVCFLCFCIYLRKKTPWFSAAVFSFTITLFPALHFFADGYQLILAARYTYLPSIFPSIITAAMIAMLYLKARSWQRHGGSAIICSVILLLVFYTATTVQLIGDWKDSGTMWSKVIAHQPFDKAYFFRGKFYADNGEYLSAIEDYTTCLSQASELTIPPIYNIYAFRGEALTKAGSFAEAADDFTAAISMFPHPLYFHHRGLALKALGKSSEAEEDFRMAGNENGPIVWLEKPVN